MLTEEQKFKILEAIENTGSWVTLAKLLADAKDSGEDLSFTDLKNNANRMISAFRFLEVRRPSVLEHPEEITKEYRAIACLPTLYGRLPDTEESPREARIEMLLDKILNKEVPTYVVERYATTLTDESKKALDDYVTSSNLQKIEGPLLPPSEEVLKATQDYKNGGPWISLAKILAPAKDRGEDLSSIGISSSHISRMISAFTYMEVRKPEALEEPEKIKASIGSLSILSHLPSTVPSELVDSYFERILSGELSEKKFSQVLQQYRSENKPPQVESKIPAPKIKDLSQLENRWVLTFMHYTSVTLEMLTQKYGFEALRSSHSKICDDIATQFRCIADPGYKKQWDERKEGTL
jgi:hypothetical protein